MGRYFLPAIHCLRWMPELLPMRSSRMRHFLCHQSPRQSTPQIGSTNALRATSRGKQGTPVAAWFQKRCSRSAMIRAESGPEGGGGGNMCSTSRSSVKQPLSIVFANAHDRSLSSWKLTRRTGRYKHLLLDVFVLLSRQPKSSAGIRDVHPLSGGIDRHRGENRVREWLGPYWADGRKGKNENKKKAQKTSSLMQQCHIDILQTSPATSRQQHW